MSPWRVRGGEGNNDAGTRPRSALHSYSAIARPSHEANVPWSWASLRGLGDITKRNDPRYPCPSAAPRYRHSSSTLFFPYPKFASSWSPSTILPAFRPQYMAVLPALV